MWYLVLFQPVYEFHQIVLDGAIWRCDEDNIHIDKDGRSEVDDLLGQNE